MCFSTRSKLLSLPLKPRRNGGRCASRKASSKGTLHEARAGAESMTIGADDVALGDLGPQAGTAHAPSTPQDVELLHLRISVVKVHGFRGKRLSAIGARDTFGLMKQFDVIQSPRADAVEFALVILAVVRTLSGRWSRNSLLVRHCRTDVLEGQRCPASRFSRSAGARGSTAVALLPLIGVAHSVKFSCQPRPTRATAHRRNGALHRRDRERASAQRTSGERARGAPPTELLPHFAARYADQMCADDDSSYTRNRTGRPPPRSAACWRARSSA